MWITDVRDRNPRRHPSWIQNAAGSKPQHWCGIETTSSGMSLSKTCVTCDSRVVPHRSTVQAHSCLTSEFGWDPVLSARYERTMEVNIQHPRKQSGEELKPRTAWDRHPLITPMKVYLWSAGIETLGLGGLGGIETPGIDSRSAGSKPSIIRDRNPGLGGSPVVAIAQWEPQAAWNRTPCGGQGSKPKEFKAKYSTGDRMATEGGSPDR